MPETHPDPDRSFATAAPPPPEALDATNDTATPDTEGMVACDMTGVLLPIDQTVQLFGRTVGWEGKQLLLRQWEHGHPLGSDSPLPTAGQRMGALLLDALIVGLLMFAPLIIFGMLIDLLPHSGMFDFLVWGVLLLSTVLPVLYFTLTQGSQTGASLGKRAAGLKVVHKSGRPLTKKRALWRAVCSHGYLSSLAFVFFALFGIAIAFNLLVTSSNSVPTETVVYVILFCIGGLAQLYPWVSLAFAFTHSERKALHDVFAGTRVVRADA